LKISVRLVFPTKAGTANHAPQHLKRKWYSALNPQNWEKFANFDSLKL
jgi:hypothetical protein